MPLSEDHIDLEPALRKIQELAREEDGSGGAYWNHVGRLLERVAEMQTEIDSLTEELERCRAVLRKTD
ncbi:hypothetical protein BG60_27875 [Caballeronia zhejiangensis]|uniref:Uncharacterized protein n=1 Tax=Caballeronia zhejiangensis TaxID=871203 RepID=A0A656Q9W9_9BURK|nr:hypothetical protein BG60_27875 [Caballeronia zhejiangensis]